jgi:hypothetical protein
VDWAKISEVLSKISATTDGAQESVSEDPDQDYTDYIWGEALWLIDLKRRETINGHRAPCYAPQDQKRIEHFLGLLDVKRLKSTRGKIYYELPGLRNRVYEHQLEPKGRRRGDYPVDAAPFLIEGLWEVMRPMLWSKYKKERFPGKDGWVLYKDRARKNLRTRVHNKARRLADERGYADKGLGLTKRTPTLAELQEEFVGEGLKEIQALMQWRREKKEREENLERSWQERKAEYREQRRKEIEKKRREAQEDTPPGEPLHLMLDKEDPEPWEPEKLVPDKDEIRHVDEEFLLEFTEAEESPMPTRRRPAPEEALQRIAKELTQDQHDVIILQAQGYSSKQIAEKLGKNSADTVRVLQMRAHKKIEKLRPELGFRG